MAIQQVDSNFKTRNTALAAYLRIEGFTLLDVEPSQWQAPAVFIFENHPRIAECEHLWQLGKDRGCCSDFFESYRLCLKMVRVGKL